MPIPIPFPMPMGPTGGGNDKFLHHHQQQQQQMHHRDDGEGEVKKIYLLQPMPKIKPPPQLKGGFVGPVQTHIHMPSPAVQHHQKPRANNDYDSPERHGDGGHKSYSDMKILPIVVIPPIAPMPPIHIAGGSSNSHVPRMTLTPQFNNYVVSSSRESGPKSRPGHQHSRSPISGYAQDDKSFSDYEENFGSSMRRGNHVARARPARSRLSGRQAHVGGQLRSASRSRQSMFEDPRDGELGDMEDFDGRRSSNQARGRRMGTPSGRHRSHQDSLDHRARTSNSIRDIINQQSMFDDDPPYSMEAASGVGGSEPMNRLNRQQLDCCNDITRVRSFGSSQLLSDSNIESDSEHREVSAPVDRDYPDQGRDSSMRQRYYDDEDMNGKPDGRHKKMESLNSAYYNRDSVDDDLTNHQSSRSSSRLEGRRPYSDGRDMYDDDQWSFDSIKSVTHAGPSANTTETSKIIESSKNNATTTTTTNGLNSN